MSHTDTDRNQRSGYVEPPQGEVDSQMQRLRALERRIRDDLQLLEQPMEGQGPDWREVYRVNFQRHLQTIEALVQIEHTIQQHRESASELEQNPLIQRHSDLDEQRFPNPQAEERRIQQPHGLEQQQQLASTLGENLQAVQPTSPARDAASTPTLRQRTQPEEQRPRPEEQRPQPEEQRPQQQQQLARSVERYVQEERQMTQHDNLQQPMLNCMIEFFAVSDSLHEEELRLFNQPHVPRAQMEQWLQRVEEELLGPQRPPPEEQRAQPEEQHEEGGHLQRLHAREQQIRETLQALDPNQDQEWQHNLQQLQIVYALIQRHSDLDEQRIPRAEEQMMQQNNVQLPLLYGMIHITVSDSLHQEELRLMHQPHVPRAQVEQLLQRVEEELLGPQQPPPEEQRPQSEEQRPQPEEQHEEGGHLQRLHAREQQIRESLQALDPNQDQGWLYHLQRLQIVYGLRQRHYELDGRRFPNRQAEERRYSQRTAERLPTINITQQVVDEETICSVCRAQFVLEESVRVLPCNHLFHASCIATWLDTWRRHTCPLCRTRV